MDEFKERILGVIFGNASGDAIGLLTEFMNARDAKLVRYIFIIYYIFPTNKMLS